MVIDCLLSLFNYIHRLKLIILKNITCIDRIFNNKLGIL